MWNDNNDKWGKTTQRIELLSQKSIRREGSLQVFIGRRLHQTSKCERKKNKRPVLEKNEKTYFFIAFESSTVGISSKK